MVDNEGFLNEQNKKLNMITEDQLNALYEVTQDETLLLSACKALSEGKTLESVLSTLRVAVIYLNAFNS